MKKYRSRNHCMILYPDDELHVKAIERIRKGYVHAMILHDEDVWTEEDLTGKIDLIESGVNAGDKKKPHWHVIIRTDNAIWNEALAKDLGIPVNYIERCKSLKTYLLYMIHHGYKDKYQYDLELVTGELKEDLIVYLSSDNRNEVQQINMIFDYIWRHTGILSVNALTTFVIEANCWSSFRRNYRIIHDVLEEKNSFSRKL